MRLVVLLFIFSSGVLAKTPARALVVYLSIDQMRPDYFERYGHLLQGGLHRLYSQGVVFTNADLNYAASETGPGHATLGTGCYPAKSGITGNDWIDRKSKNKVYCVEDSTAKSVEGDGGGFSPKNLMVPAIGDWLKENSKKSKVVAVSSKDRAAILMGGLTADYVFWYGKKNGTMVTSDYYMTFLPSWAKDFNNSGWVDKNVPNQWTKSLPESIYATIGPDEFFAEQQWNEKSSFPHTFAPGKKSEQMMGTPYGDFLLIDFALAAVKGEHLGQRNVTDILCLSLSNCDYVGHGYGPDSHEILDLLIKIDKRLGTFLDELDKTVGKDNYVVAISADHAVCPLPEFNQQFRNIDAHRYIFVNDIKPALDSLSSSLKHQINSSEDLIKNNFINYAAAANGGWDSLRIEKMIAEGVLDINAYVDVYFRRELIGNESSDRPFIQKYRNGYFDPRSEDFQYRVREHCIISSRSYGTTHGSPYSYDTHVPLMFWWNKVQPQMINRPVHTVDIAPTLAKFAGFQFPSSVDGVPLREVLE